MSAGTTQQGVLVHYLQAAQDWQELYLWWRGVNSIPQGDDISDEELYRWAVTAASAGEGPSLAEFEGRFLYAHQRLRDSLTDLAGVLDTMSAPSSHKSPSGGAASS